MEKHDDYALDLSSDNNSGGRNSPALVSTNVNEKKLMRKLDLRIIPVLTILYILAFIDRVNIGNAVLFGLRQDLAISSSQYNTALSVFFVSYCALEIPANILMKKVKPPIFLSTCVFLFGLLVVCQGFCTNFGSLLAIRFLLGAVEAGTFPGCFYILSMWYKREESQRRFSFFYNGASLAGAFGGLLASAIGKLDHYNGHRGWKWIFWLEGGFTCFMAIIAWFTIPDFPEAAKWLSEDERSYVIHRLSQQQGRSGHDEKITLKGVTNFFKDWRTIPVALMYFGPTVSGYGLAYFIPTIVSTYGYSTIQSQLYSVPPWAAAFALSMIIAYLSDRTRQRFPFIVFCHLLALSGCITLFNLHTNNKAQYACLCLYLMGVISTLPLIVCWNVMNLEGHTNKAVGAAWQVGTGNIAGIVSAWSFPESSKPRYTLGYSLGIGFLAASLTMSCVYYFLMRRVNAQRKMDGKPLLFL